MTNRLTLSAPAVIYLQVSDDKADLNEEFDRSAFNYEITWCQDSVMNAEVKYVRADLALATNAVVATPAPDAEAFANQHVETFVEQYNDVYCDQRKAGVGGGDAERAAMRQVLILALGAFCPAAPAPDADKDHIRSALQGAAAANGLLRERAERAEQAYAEVTKYCNEREGVLRSLDEARALLREALESVMPEEMGLDLVARINAFLKP